MWCLLQPQDENYGVLPKMLFPYEIDSCGVFMMPEKPKENMPFCDFCHNRGYEVAVMDLEDTKGDYHRDNLSLCRSCFNFLRRVIG